MNKKMMGIMVMLFVGLFIVGCSNSSTNPEDLPKAEVQQGGDGKPPYLK